MARKMIHEVHLWEYDRYRLSRRARKIIGSISMKDFIANVWCDVHVYEIYDIPFHKLRRRDIKIIKDCIVHYKEKKKKT